MPSFSRNELKLNRWSLLGCLLLTNVLTLVGLLFNTDIVGIWQSRSDTLAAYELRIAQLSGSVDLLRLRELTKRGTATLKLQEVVELQRQVSERLVTLQSLVTTAANLGVVQLQIAGVQAVSTVAQDTRPAGQLDVIEAELRAMEQEIVAQVAMLSAAADRSTDMIVAELDRVGHSPEDAELGRGGPLMPPADIDTGAEFLAVRRAVAALDRLREARQAMDDVPIHQPVDTSLISSNFGPREDPFTGQSAFHSGIDFPAPSGTPVRSAGSGVVTFVGWKGDYGNVVEITHLSGLISRYPHLSKALVQEGDRVDADMEIALVGSTGRSTGPHLHFELRDQNGAVDPAPYLAAGKRLHPFGARTTDDPLSFIITTGCASCSTVNILRP
ncbi:MAG: M23 family metallopeptidase [Devosia marina]|uniref:M23 family metallopeptidase n=1 Tax=Devosia marina TaxID=2683198 RepID=UPI0032EBA93F